MIGCDCHTTTWQRHDLCRLCDQDSTCKHCKPEFNLLLFLVRYQGWLVDLLLWPPLQVLGDWEGTVWQRSNLDMLISVLDSTGNTIATIDPPTTFTANGLGAATVSIDLPAPDWYYVTVAGTGSGNPADTGYSNYASMGQFMIAVAYQTDSETEPPSVPSTPPPPRYGSLLLATANVMFVGVLVAYNCCLQEMHCLRMSHAQATQHVPLACIAAASDIITTNMWRRLSPYHASWHA